MALKAFDPGNGKWYKNIKEHVTKQAPKGLEPTTKKLIQDMQPKKQKAKP
jgi:hypothetical protein